MDYEYDKMNTEVYQAWFEDFDVETVYADDGETGLEKAKEINPNLIIPDIYLPGIDGIATIQKLRKMQEHRNTPIVVVSASTFTDKKELAFKEGCSEYLVKPLDFDVFLGILEKYLKIKIPYKHSENYYAILGNIPENIKHSRRTSLHQ